MKVLHISFYTLLVVLLPLTIHAGLTGHIVYRHPYNYDEIWITDINDTRNARLLFKHTNVIQDLSVQKNSRYIAIASRNENNVIKEDTYLIDTLRGKAVLIQDKIKDIACIDISHDGDVVFSTSGSHQGVLPDGIYLIRRNEIGKQASKIIKKVRGVYRIDWAPNGRQIAYDATKGIFILDVDTRNETRISREGRHLAFSPDGKKFAFSYLNVATGNRQIDIISLDTRQPLRTIKDFGAISWIYGIRWSPDGGYLIYIESGRLFFEQKTVYHNIAIPVNGGPPEKILDIGDRGVSLFDWINPAYPVEPANRLTTLWSSMKQ